MKQTLKLFLALTVLILHFGAKSQDIHFSQIFETPLLRNPSLAGVFTGDIRVQSVYRTQWNTVTVPYQTTSLSGEYKKSVGSGDDFITIGGQILYDKAGTVALSTTQVLPAFNYQKSLSDQKNMYLSLGVMGGLVQRRFDRSKMTTNNMYDGTSFNEILTDGETFVSPSYAYFDGSVGMSFNSQIGTNDNNNMFLGISYHHLNQAKRISFYNSSSEQMTPKWVASSGFRIGSGSASYITIQADYSKQGSYTEIVTGALYSIKLQDVDNPMYMIHAGAYMRLNDAIIPVVKLECKPVAIAVSYDANISQLKQSSSGHGGYEVSLTFLQAKYHNSSLEKVRCPKF